MRYDRAGRVKFVATAPISSGPYATPKGVTQAASAARLRRLHPNAHCVATAVPITFPDRLIRGQNCYFGAKAALARPRPPGDLAEHRATGSSCSRWAVAATSLGGLSLGAASRMGVAWLSQGTATARRRLTIAQRSES